MKAAVLEQSLPCGQARDWQAGAHREVDVARQWRKVARLNGYILRQGAVAVPVREAEHPLSQRQTCRAIPEVGDHSGQLVPRDRRCSVAIAAIGPGRRPTELSPDESRRMNLNDYVVYRCPRLGPLRQLHARRSRSLVRHNDRFHGNCLLVHLSVSGNAVSPGGCRSRTNADDRLPPGSLGSVEGGDGVVEGREGADVCPKSSAPPPFDDLNQWGTIGLDDEVDRQAVGGPCLGRAGDGHQSSSGSNQGCGPLSDVAAEDIENQINWADVFQGVVLEVDE